MSDAKTAPDLSKFKVLATVTVGPDMPFHIGDQAKNYLADEDEIMKLFDDGKLDIVMPEEEATLTLVVVEPFKDLDVDNDGTHNEVRAAAEEAGLQLFDPAAIVPILLNSAIVSTMATDKTYYLGTKPIEDDDGDFCVIYIRERSGSEEDGVRQVCYAYDFDLKDVDVDDNDEDEDLSPMYIFALPA